MEKILIKNLTNRVQEIEAANKSVEDLKAAILSLKESRMLNIETGNSTQNKNNSNDDNTQIIMSKSESLQNSSQSMMRNNVINIPKSESSNNQNITNTQNMLNSVLEKPDKRFVKSFSCSKKEQERLDDIQTLMIEQLGIRPKSESDLIRFCINVVWKDKLWTQYPKHLAKIIKK